MNNLSNFMLSRGLTDVIDQMMRQLGSLKKWVFLIGTFISGSVGFATQPQVHDALKMNLHGIESQIQEFKSDLPGNKSMPFAPKVALPLTDSDAQGKQVSLKMSLSPEHMKEISEIEMKRIRRLEEHHEWQMKHIKTTYELQGRISKWLFWGLSCMTLVSLLLCIAQFALGMGLSWSKNKRQESATPGLSEVEIAPDRLKLQSNAMGILLMAFTLAFFYLLVKEVYPISAGP